MLHKPETGLHYFKLHRSEANIVKREFIEVQETKNAIAKNEIA